MPLEQVSLDATPSKYVCLRHYRLTGLVSGQVAVTMTFDLENLASNAHSHDEYLWQVSLKSLH